MPTIGPFHRNFWRSRANTPVAPGVGPSWMYPQVQSVVTMHAVLFGLPLDWIGSLWTGLISELRWLWQMQRATASERAWIADLLMCDAEQAAVVSHVVETVRGPHWAPARVEVRACATSPKFHQPEQWVGYSRIVKSNPGQAQNIWRHMRVVQAMQAADSTITNPEAHLAAELAYQGFALSPRVFKVRPVGPLTLFERLRRVYHRYAHV